MSFHRFFVFLLLAGLIQATARAQSAACLRAVYQLDYKLDSTAAVPKRVQMILRVSNGTSRFESTGMHIYDSVYTNSPGLADMVRLKTALDAQRGAAKNEFRYTILKEPVKNAISYHDNISSQDYQYQEKMPLLSWRIMPAKKTIAGYECQQALATFGGRQWEAWFAREVPVSDGPYKFSGLPGLILQVSDTRANYVFSLLCLDTNPQPFVATAASDAPLTASTSAPVISKSKFVEAKHNDDVTFIDRMVAQGNQVPESVRQNHLQMLKRRNNPLELK